MPQKRQLRTPKIPTSSDAPSPITALAQSSGKQSKLAIARFGKIEIHDASGKVVSVINDLDGKVNAMSFDKSGERLLVASGITGGFGRAAIFEVSSGKLQQEINGHRDTLYAAVFHRTKRRLRRPGTIDKSSCGIRSRETKYEGSQDTTAQSLIWISPRTERCSSAPVPTRRPRFGASIPAKDWTR